MIIIGGFLTLQSLVWATSYWLPVGYNFPRREKWRLQISDGAICLDNSPQQLADAHRAADADTIVRRINNDLYAEWQELQTSSTRAMSVVEFKARERELLEDLYATGYWPAIYEVEPTRRRAGVERDRVSCVRILVSGSGTPIFERNSALLTAVPRFYEIGCSAILVTELPFLFIGYKLLKGGCRRKGREGEGMRMKPGRGLMPST